jgi:flagellin
MAELRRMAQDVTKNSADVKNYSEEFIELQSQLNQISNDSFFGKILFASHNAGSFNSGLKLGTTSLGSAEYNTFSVALATHDFGNSNSGSVSINVVNFQFMLSLGSLAKNGTGHFYNLANIERANGTTGVNADGYIDDVQNVSVSQFIDIMERITDVRAENGAEQNRVIQRINLLQSNLTNIEAVHARIIHKDTPLKSSRLTRHNIHAQECASKNTKANQLTKVALSLTA